MDSVLLPHLIEGRFVTAVELGAGCGIMALQLFAHGKTTLLHLAESNPLLFEALRLTTAINALDGFFMLYQTDVENLRVSGDLVYFNPPYGRGKVGKGERWQPFMTFLEKNRYKEVAYICPPQLDSVFSQFLGSRMNLRKEVQVWYKHSTRIVKQWTYEKVTPLRKALVVPSEETEQMYWDCP
ncbi:MAG TPA: methyltransferase [Coprothermobacter proteolyticus]|nr:methyltransferase [Coprothermobacter sp.]HOL53547.1 methyltransferase [Coprothermobacter proteolyticus]